MVELIILILLAGGIGVATGTWLSLIVPVAGTTVYYLGLEQGWWGCCGAGEAWWPKMLFFAGLFAIVAAVGVMLRKLTSRLVRA